MINALIFAYFVTLHADQLGITLFSHNFRLNNLIAIFLILLFINRSLIFSIESGLFKVLSLILFSLSASVLGSYDFSRSFLFIGWFFFSLVAYFFLPLILYERCGERKIFTLYMVSFLGVGCYALLQLLLSVFGICDPFCSQYIHNQIVRPNACAYEPSYYALYMTPFVMGINTAYLIGFTIEGKKMRGWQCGITNALYLLSTSASVIFAYGIFGIVLYCATFFSKVKARYPFLRGRIYQALLGLFLFSFFFLWLLPEFSKKFLFKFFYAGLSHHSFQERWQGICDAWEVFLQHPCLGIGFGSYPEFMMERWQRGEKEVVSRMDFLFLENTKKLFEPSNVLTELLASLGFLGLVAFLALGIFFVKRIREAFRNAEERERNCCFILLISIVVTICIWQMNQGLLRGYIWVHFALSFAFFNRIIGSKNGCRSDTQTT